MKLSWRQARRMGIHGFGGVVGLGQAFGTFGGEWEDYCDRTYGGAAEMVKKCRAWSVFAPWTIAGKAARGLPVTWSAVATAAGDLVGQGSSSSPPAPATPQSSTYQPGGSSIATGPNPYLDYGASASGGWSDLVSKIPKLALGVGAAALGLGAILYLKKRGGRSGSPRARR